MIDGHLPSYSSLKSSELTEEEKSLFYHGYENAFPNDLYYVNISIYIKRYHKDVKEYYYEN